MSTEYASLKDSRPELIGGLNKCKKNLIENKVNRVITINENKFMNMSLSQIFNKIINILPNIYNDYYRKHLETKIKMKSMDLNTSESNIFKKL